MGVLGGHVGGLVGTAVLCMLLPSLSSAWEIDDKIPDDYYEVLGVQRDQKGPAVSGGTSLRLGCPAVATAWPCTRSVYLPVCVRAC